MRKVHADLLEALEHSEKYASKVRSSQKHTRIRARSRGSSARSPGTASEEPAGIPMGVYPHWNPGARKWRVYAILCGPPAGETSAFCAPPRLKSALRLEAVLKRLKASQRHAPGPFSLSGDAAWSTALACSLCRVVVRAE